MRWLQIVLLLSAAQAIQVTHGVAQGQPQQSPQEAQEARCPGLLRLFHTFKQQFSCGSRHERSELHTRNTNCSCNSVWCFFELASAAAHRKLLQDNVNVTEVLGTGNIKSTNNMTDASNASSVAAVAKPSLNPWYDQHFLSRGAVWGSGLLYGMFNTTGKPSLDSASIYSADASDEPQAHVDPPPYEYPPVDRHPTVFFTAVLFQSKALLQPGEQVAFSSAINDFLAPTPATVVTNTTVITQALVGGGLWLPCATVFFGKDTAVLQDYLATTLQSDPNLILPTATWGSVRTTNIKVAQPAAPASITFTWAVGEYTNCSVMCGGGTQQRLIACLDSYGNAADASMCPLPSPPSSRSCQMQPCHASSPSSFDLVLGPWSVCNSTCSYGGRTRAATCVSKEGYIGSLADCNTTPQELFQQLWQPCILPPCPTFIWSFSDWQCDNRGGCGGGTARRNATCIIASTSQAVAPSMCPESLLDASTQACAQAPCVVFYWRARELADCLPEEPSKPCGRYLQRRGFDCVNMTSSEVVTNNFCNSARPVLGEVECTRPPEVDCTNRGETPGVQPAASPAADVTPSSGISAAPNPAVEASSSSTSPASSAGAPTSSTIAPQQANVAAVAMDGPSSSTTGTASSPGNSDSSSTATAADASPASATSPVAGQVQSDAVEHAADAHSGVADTASASKPSNVTTGASSAAGSTHLSMDIGSTSSNGAGSGNGIRNSSNASSSASSAVPGVAPGTGQPTLPNSISPDTHTDTPVSTSSSSSNGGDAGLLDMGSGSTVPAWLLNDPTPTLKALLECTGGYALSGDGKCCSGSLIDSQGTCCELGHVDACGVCNGTGKALDSLGACCSGVLDAEGICCIGSLDECGVCNGTNACDTKVELVASVSPAVLYLVPASNANRRLRAALQEKAAVAISAAVGRAFDKSRVSVMLSAYSPQSSVASAKTQPAVDGAISVSETPDEPVLPGSATPTGAASTSSSADSRPPVAALPFMGGGSSTGSDPVQMDSVISAPEQLDAPTSHANLATSTSSFAGLQKHVSTVERAVKAQGLATPMTSATASGNMGMGLANQAIHTEGVLRRLQHTWHQVSFNRSTAKGMLLQAASSSSAPDQLDTSNALRVTMVLKAPATGTGADTGSVLLALNTLVNQKLSIPGSRNELQYQRVVSVVRAGTCGDGVCQVNERPSWNNPDSCQADCALPFLSCPPFNSDQMPCHGLGVCYNSIGSCACTRGYAGADCGSCAVGYKRVNGYCVATAVLVPQRLCAGGVCLGNVTDGASLVPPTPARSMLEGQVAVTVVVLVTMSLVAGAAVLVFRARYKRLLFVHAQEVAERARMAAD